MPDARLINPETVEPTEIDSELHRSGRAVHKRLVSMSKDGSKLMDVGYNRYQAGVEFQGLKQEVDAICYVISGEGEFTNGIQTQSVHRGMIIYQPKGSVIGMKCLTDMEALCVFSPARV